MVGAVEEVAVVTRVDTLIRDRLKKSLVTNHRITTYCYADVLIVSFMYSFVGWLMNTQTAHCSFFFFVLCSYFCLVMLP